MQAPPLWCECAVGESMLLGSMVCAVGSHTAGGFGPSCTWGAYELTCTSGGTPRSKKKKMRGPLGNMTPSFEIPQVLL